MRDWLIDSLFSWLIDWLISWLIDWLISWLIDLNSVLINNLIILTAW